MKEIGGFLEWETYEGKELHNNCIALNSGRNCLRYLIKTKNIKKYGFLSYYARLFQILARKRMLILHIILLMNNLDLILINGLA